MPNFITIPTRFDRDTIWPLIAEARQIATVVLVHTEPDHPDVDGCVNLRSQSLSIQQWWNDGLDRCDGPALVLNDDIVATAADLNTLLDALSSSDLVYLAGHRVGHATPLTGWCFGLWPERIRPDTAFGWWYGDDDLYRRAVQNGLTITAVDLPIIHQRPEAAFSNPAHAEMVQADADLYRNRWG